MEPMACRDKSEQINGRMTRGRGLMRVECNQSNSTRCTFSDIVYYYYNARVHVNPYYCRIIILWRWNRVDSSNDDDGDNDIDDNDNDNSDYNGLLPSDKYNVFSITSTTNARRCDAIEQALARGVFDAIIMKYIHTEFRGLDQV